MTDDVSRAMNEAENWLVSARDSLVRAQSEDASAAVACAQAIHAMIRANDALTMKLTGLKATQHDDAPILFARLIDEGKLPKSMWHLQRIFSKAMRDKSGADYGRRIFTYEKAGSYVADAEEFIRAVKRVV